MGELERREVGREGEGEERSFIRGASFFIFGSRD